MARKFFNLIHEGQFHVSPKTKRIPAKEFSSLLSGKEIVTKAKQDSELFRKEVAAECETIKEQSCREGFEAGFSQWVEKLAELEQEIATVREETEKMVVPVALQAAKKIVNREIQTSKDVIIDIITKSLKSVAQHKRIVIFVNREELATVEKEKNALMKYFEALESLAIVPRKDVEPGGCIIETEGGIINAQLANQWLILENAFESLVRTTLTSSTSKGPTK